MGWDKASGGVYDYYGSVVGAVCAGPVTHLMGVIVDGKLVWPGYVVWTEGQYYGAGAIVSYGGRIFQCVSGHTATKQNAPLSSYWQVFTVWLGDKSNPYVITVPGYGMLFLYRGTDDQQAHYFGVMGQFGHPPYRGICVVELVHWYLGRMRQAAPNLQLVLRRWPSQTILTGSLSWEDKRGQMNPLAALAEILTNPRTGAGLPTSVIDTTSWTATATELYNRAASCYLSPKLESGTTVKSFTAELLRYFDGWLRVNNEGKIVAGRFPHAESLPAQLPTVTYNDLVDEPTIEGKSFETTANEVVVKFADSARGWNEAAVKAVDRANWAVTGSPRLKTVEAPWINWADQASEYASELLKSECWPTMSGSIRARQSKLSAIQPGSLFVLNNDVIGTALVARCTSARCSDPDRDEVEIEWQSETTAPYAAFHPAPKPAAGTAAPEPETPTPEQMQVWQVPACICNAPHRVAVLAHRTKYETAAIRVWCQIAGEQYYSELGQQTAYALRGAIAQDHGVWAPAVQTANRSRTNNVARINCYPNMHGLVENQTVDIRGLGGTGYNKDGVAIHWVSVWEFEYASTGPDESQTADTGGVVTKNPYEDWSEGIRITPEESIPAEDWSKIEGTLTTDDVNDNRLLCVVFKASDPTEFEVMSVRLIYLNNGVYRLRAKRGVDGRPPMQLVQGDRAWLLWRKQLVAYAHETFPQLEDGGTIKVKLQAVTPFGQSNLSDTEPLEYTFGSTFKPTIDWLKAEVRLTESQTFGPVSWNTEYPATAEFRLTAKATALDSYLSEFKLVAMLGSSTVTLCSMRERLSEKVAVAQFRLPSLGNWQVFAVASDEAGRVKESELFIDGALRTIRIGDQATVLTPIIYPRGGPYRTFPKEVTLTCATPDALIYYQITDLYGTPNQSNWVEYTGPVTLYADKSLHAYAGKDQMADSAIVAEHYWLDESGRARPGGTEEP